MFTDVQRRLLTDGAAEWQIALTEAQICRFERVATLLEAGNRQLNLTRICPDDYVILHFLDSLALAAVTVPPPAARMIDVGTGAGFPGVPLAIAYPDLSVTLLDATLKRLRFVDDMISELGIDTVTTLHGRAEEIAHVAEQRSRYDLVTARAVAALPILVDRLLPFARIGGLVVAYKARDVSDEIEAARTQIESLGGAIECVADVPLPGSDIVRTLVLIRKQREPAMRVVALRRRR